ncbi:MAG: EamA family transporter [Planctomycetota bacterium]
MRPTLADLLLVLVALMWGTNFSVIKVALAEFPPLTFNALRLVLSIGTMVLIARVMGHSLAFGRADWGWIARLGLLGHTFYQALFIWGADGTTAGNSALLLATPPVFIALIGRVLGYERIAALGWLGIGLSLGGIVAILLGGDQRTELEFGGATMRGDLLMFLATLNWSAFTVALRPAVRRHGPVKVTVLSTTFGTLPFLALSAPAIAGTDFGAISRNAWLITALSSLIGISLPYFLWNYGVSKLGSARTSLYSYLTPPVALVVAWIWLGERMSLQQAAGGLLVLVGVVLARRNVTTAD